MVKDLKDLQAFLKLCRKQGVTSITCEGLTVTLGDLPRKDSGDAEEDASEKSPSFDDLTIEEQIAWSLNGGAQ